MSELTFDDLSEDQKNAHDRVIKNIRNKIHTTITGGPGVGKTTLVKFVFETLKKLGISGIWLTAPTHQAKNVLSEAVGMDATTIHSALKISPVTNEELRVFEQQKGKKAADLSECRVFVVEEVSMVDKELFRIIKRTIPSCAVILGLGDKDQIRPVNTEGITELSPFFDEEIFDVIRMDKIMRQAEGNPIIQVSRAIRDGKPLMPLMNGELGVMKHENAGDFLRRYFSRVKTPDDLNNNRMFAYTNANVDKLNAVIRKHLYKTDQPFIVGEVVVMQEPLVTEGRVNGVSFVEVIYNNNEQIKILEIIPRSDTIKADRCDPVQIDYFLMKTESMFEDTKADIQVIADPVMQERLGDYLNYVAFQYKKMKPETGYKAPWYSFWQIKNKFQTVKALPVCTYHKGQGSTYDHSYMYTRDAYAYADYELCKQLLYVGTTRARFTVDYV